MNKTLYSISMVSIISLIFLVYGCDLDIDLPGFGDYSNYSTPTTGTIAGIVTFVGTSPDRIGEIRVSIFDKLDENRNPIGKPCHQSKPFIQFTGKVKYELEGISFGTYEVTAVTYKKPDSLSDTPLIIMGIYGCSPSGDVQPDPFTIGTETVYYLGGIDITADYNATKNDN